MYSVGVSNLVVTRSNYPALANANLEIAPTFCALVTGANGSGKTTLLKALSGLEPAARGSISVEEKLDFAKPTDIRVLRQRVSYIGHSPLYMRHVTVKEHIELCRSFDHNSKTITAEKIDEVLERFNLANRLNVKVENLSAGQQRRLHLASSFVRTNSILCIDEPHASLDEPSKKLVDNMISDLKTNSRSTFIATHEPERLLSLATHIVEIQNGSATLKAVN